MQFAIDNEAGTMGLYEQAVRLSSSKKVKAFFADLVEQLSKRVDTLERIRRENITEMILEPITDFYADEYPLKLEMNENDDRVVCESAIIVEETRMKFFRYGAQKLEFLIEVADAFERMADENQENIDSLRSFL